ncbi:hypothetical protein [Bacillus halotolerans]|uniref:hypothetical protein n=1 Tax=Bacillus halotolerans TaxID=260554 RepID=UPI003305C130
MSLIGQYIDTTSAMPQREFYANMQTGILQGKLLGVSDPYALAISDQELTEVQISKHEEDWEAIATYILPNMSGLIKKKEIDKNYGNCKWEWIW